jgi:hypothetical protein
MTYVRIIILIGIIIGILLFKKTKPNFSKGLLIGFVLSLGISFFGTELSKTISFLSFGILTFIFSVYSGINKKWLNLIIGLFAFVSFFFKSMHFPYGSELELSMIIPIIVYLVILGKDKFKNKQLSILTILIVYELTDFLKLITKWF